MTPRDFCYWLKGYFELSPSGFLDATQVAMIHEHLQLVFQKKTVNWEPVAPMGGSWPQPAGTM